MARHFHFRCPECSKQVQADLDDRSGLALCSCGSLVSISQAAELSQQQAGKTKRVAEYSAEPEQVAGPKHVPAARPVLSPRKMPPFQEATQSPKGDSATPFDPYHRWLGIRPEEQPADHYRLLGLVRFEDDLEAIRDAAARQMAHVRSYALGPHVELSQRILNELATAKACLLEPAKKAEYDLRLGKDLRVTERRDTVVGAMPSCLAEKDEAAVEEQWPPASQVLLAGSSSPGTRSAWRLIGYGIGGAVGVAAVIAIAFWATRGGPGPSIAPSEDSLRAQLAQLKLELAQLKQEPEVQAATKGAPPSAPGAPPSVATRAERAATDSTKPADKSSGASPRFDANTTVPVSDSPNVPENAAPSSASKTPMPPATGIALQGTEQVSPQSPARKPPEPSSESQNAERDGTKLKLLRAVCAERVVTLAQWESAKSRLEELNAKLAEQQGKLVRLNANGANVQQQGAYIEGRIRFLVNNEAAYTSDAQTAADYAQTLDALRTRLGVLQGQYSALDSEAREVNTVVAGHQQQILGVQAEIARLFQKANQLRAQWLELTDVFGSLQRGEHERAIATLTEWTILESTNAHPYLLRGLVYEQAGDQKHAQADFRRASQLAPREAPALLRWYHERMKRNSISPGSPRKNAKVERAGAGDGMPSSTPKADLPKPAKAPVRRPADASHTLAYWKERTKIEEEALRRMRSPKPKTLAQQVAALRKEAAGRRFYADSIAPMDATGVDEALVAAVLEEAKTTRAISQAMSRICDAVEAGDYIGREVAKKAKSELDALWQKNDQVYFATFDRLRVELSQKYGLEFPSYLPGMAAPRTSKGADADAEARAESLLGIAMRFIDLQQHDTAKRWLQRIVKECPDTEAAKRAKRLLDNPDSDDDASEEADTGK